MDLSDRLLKLKNKSKRIRSELDHARGRREGLMKSLLKNYDLNTLPEAKKELKIIDKKYHRLSDKIESNIKVIEDKYDI